MLAAWAGGTDGNLFLWCRRPAVNLTSEGSVNNSWGKNLWIHIGNCERNIFHYLGGEDWTLLVWNLEIQLVF